MLTRTKLVTNVAMLIVLTAPTANAIVTSDAPGTHVVSPGEEVFDLNLDGVASLTYAIPDFNEIGCTGSLISDRHIISAAHCFDSETGLFDEGADGNVDEFLKLFEYTATFHLQDQTIEIPLDLGEVQFPGEWPEVYSDIAIVQLAEDAPAEIPRYSLYGGDRIVGQKIVVAGYGLAGHGPTGMAPFLDQVPTKRAGLNRYDVAIDDVFPGAEVLGYDFDSGLPENNAFAFNDVPSDLGFGADEVLLALGDSGGPVFVNGSIAGISSVVVGPPEADFTSESDGSWGEAAFDASVRSQRPFILAATDGTAVFVPEPQHAASATLIAILLFIRFSRCH